MAKNFKIHKINDAEFHFSLMKYPNSIHRNRLKQLPQLKLYTDGPIHNKNLENLPAKNMQNSVRLQFCCLKGKKVELIGVIFATTKLVYS